jgi:dihydroxyacetone kinase phosphotransfer subunit
VSVGIVVVSHSRALADAAVELALQMVHGEEPPIAIAAGTADGGLGTIAGDVAEAIERVATPAGVLVLVDLGSAVLNAELALELLPPGIGPVRLSAAPLVEGLVGAVVRSAGGAGLDEVADESEAAFLAKREHLAAAAPPTESGAGAAG